MNHSRNSFLTHLLLNCIPILGYWFWDWDVFTLIYLFWIEGVVIVFFDGLKIMTAGMADPVYPAFGNKIFKTIKISLIRFGLYLFYWVFIVMFIGLMDNERALDAAIIIGFADKNFNLLILAFITHQIVDYLLNFRASGLYKIKKSSDYTFFFQGRFLILHVTIVLGVFGFQLLKQFEHFHEKIPGLSYLIILSLLKSVGDYMYYAGRNVDLQKIKSALS